ncbi:MAG: glycosyltransferase family 2 protein [Candidatus Diapherotrites archaeon]|nr:glycosyltransferase family 2 protein [Candidatus Diapherotrites archaeon]
MTFEQKRMGAANLLLLIGVLVFFLSLFLFVFFNPEYSRVFYVLVASIGLYITVFYVLTDRDEPVALPVRLKRFPSLTVVIPSYNSASSLGDCLSAVLKMNYPRKFSVWVIDDGSKDNTKEVLGKFPKVKVLSQPVNIGKAKGLNQIIRTLKTDLVVCIDSDTYPNPNVLLDCVPRFFARENVGAVAPFITVANPRNFLQRMQEVEYFSGFGFYSKVAAQLDGLYVAPGPLTVFSRKALLAVKGFDEDNLTEDMEIALRLHHHGFALEYSPSRVPTEVPSTFTGLYRQRIRWYRGTIFNLMKYREMFFSPRLKSFGNFFFPALALFVSTIILSFVVIWAIILYGTVQWFSQLYYSFSVGQFPLIRLVIENMTVNSLVVFLLMAVVLWYVFFKKSLSLIAAKSEARMVLPALAMIFFYPLMISVIYAAGLFKELRSSRRSW